MGSDHTQSQAHPSMSLPLCPGCCSAEAGAGNPPGNLPVLPRLGQPWVQLGVPCPPSSTLRKQDKYRVPGAHVRWMERPWDSQEGAETPAHHTGIVSRSQALGQICARLSGRQSWRWRGGMGPPINPNHGSPWGSGVDPALGQAGAAAQLSDGLIAPFQGRIYASCSPGVTWATTALTEVCPGSAYTKPHHKGFFLPTYQIRKKPVQDTGQ